VQPTHAWFVAYAPSENPTLALAIYVWNGGQGSGVAAPVAQRIINDYFKLGVPEDKLKKVTKDQDSQE
jgi:penicillin-binding protein 2